MTRAFSYRQILLFLSIGILCACFLWLALPHHAHAQWQTQADITAEQGFKPLAGIPFINGTYTLPTLLNALYKLSIVVGALLAVVFIAIGGFQYMSPTVGGKSAGLERIQSALFGLLILLTTALILKTIFGDVTFDVLNLPPIQAPVTQNNSATPPVNPTNPSASPRTLNPDGTQTGTAVGTPDRACARMLARAATSCSTGQVAVRDSGGTCGCGTAQ